MSHGGANGLWEALTSSLGEDGKVVLMVAGAYSKGLRHYYVGTEHLFMATAKLEGSLTQRVLAALDLDPKETRDRLKIEAGPGYREALWEGMILTPRVVNTLVAARDFATDEGCPHVGERHLLLAILEDEDSLPSRVLQDIGQEKGFDPSQLLSTVRATTWNPPSEGEAPYDLEAGFGAPVAGGLIPEVGDIHFGPPLREGGVTSVLTRCGRDLTQAAQEGKIGPAEGENARRAMTQIGRILLQSEANNPIVLGDPGVGKTAVVEGFAWRLAGGGKGAHERLAGRRVVELSTSDLLAGTKYRGDLEQRLQRLLAEVKAGDGQVIVFIDEIHGILGGGASGGLSAIADALKPALSRGEFPCIGATTVAEYRKHIEKDPALARRFTPVWLEEPTIEEANQIVEKVAMGRLTEHHNVTFAPEAIEAAVKLSARYVHDESLPGKAIKVLDQAATKVVLGGSLSGVTPDEAATWGNTVTVDMVLEVIADRTNIPIEQLGKTDKQRLLDLEDTLKVRVKGQNEAIEKVVRVLKRAGAGFADPRRPLGVFLFAGLTGVGKTELALALAEALFDDEDAIFRLDMSEFMEKHQVSRLIGAPPGYIRSEEEGQLTGRLRRRPYSVVLLDEIEKAHAEVQHLFLQLFDTGRLTGGHGHVADGRNAIFIMTTNLGAKQALGFVDTASYRDKLRAAIYDHFSLEFINRIDRIIYFAPLDEKTLLEIFDREFAPFQARFRERGIEVDVAEHVKRQIVEHVAKLKLGARPLRRLIEDQIVSPLTDKLLAGEITSGVHITIGQDVDLHASTPFPLPDQTPAELDEPETGEDQVPSDGSSVSPVEGLPHLSDVTTPYQEAFDKLFIALAARLKEQDIAIEITESAKRFLCSPDYLELRGNRPVEPAFGALLEDPLAEELLAEKFQAGDRVRVVLGDDYTIDFEKVEGEAE